MPFRPASALALTAVLWAYFYATSAPPPVDLPPHLLGNPCVHTPNLLTEEQADRLLAMTREVAEFQVNTRASVKSSVTHEHVGEATPLNEKGACDHPLLVPNLKRTHCVLPGRVDIGRHFIKHGGPEALKEDYDTLVSRVQSFGRFVYNLDEFPIMRELFNADDFQKAAKFICPKDKQTLDPLQFNVIINVPGQTVATHIDSVQFWGANRSHYPEWLLAAMSFSGLWQDRFVDQVQTVAYFHRWTDESKGLPNGTSKGDYIFYEANAAPHSHPPDPLGAISLDGTKVVHAAAVYMPTVKPPRIDRSKIVTLRYDGGQTWSVVSDGEVMQTYHEDQLRLSIVYRARCFASEAARLRFHSLPASEFLTLDDILGRFRDDLLKRGVLTKAQVEADDRLELAMAILETYITYPFSTESIVPYNYCAATMQYPWLKPALALLGC